LRVGPGNTDFASLLGWFSSRWR